MQSLSRILREACGDDRVKDTVKGGVADKMDPSSFDQKELMRGMHVELEHTDDILQSMEIAMDHLAEDPDYYEKLEAIHQEDIGDETGDQQMSALEAEFGDDEADLESGRRNKNLDRTWKRVWKGKQ